MSITVKNISVSIGGVCSTRFDINLDGALYHMDHFVLEQRLLQPNHLSFSLHKGPLEDINEPMLTLCGQLIGKEITVNIQTENFENLSLNASQDTVEDIDFKGVVVAASGDRSGSVYTVQVDARSWDALLDDNPSCKSYEDKSLNDIVQDVLEEYRSSLDPEVDARFTDSIPYCVQYNETHLQFLQRLACRYGEWLYNDGTKLVFGNLDKKSEVSLEYPSKDVPSYHMELKMRHPAFQHAASSYNAYDASQKDGLGEMQGISSELNGKAFSASQDNYTKQTLQYLHSGGYADEDSREPILNTSTKTQGGGERVGMMVFSGTSFSSKVKLGATLTIKDNYISDSASNSKSGVEQESILITEVVHYCSADETYRNQFAGVAADSEYPPYANREVYPKASSCRARVIDNEDPHNLGRVRVQFDWQRLQDSGMMTPWLRIAQPYAGKEKGFSFIPEKDEEVMVGFEGGNAERPYVKGTLFNGSNNPDQAWLPGSNEVKAIRTQNGHTIEIHDAGEGGYIRIYDNKKENYILTFSTDEQLIKLESTGNIELYAQNDIIMEAGNDMQISVGASRTLDVGQDDATTVGNEQSLKVGSNRSVKVGADQEVSVGGDQSEKVGGNETVQIGSNRLVDISGSQEVKVSDSNYLSAKDHREDIDNEVVVVANSQQYKSSSFTKIDGGTQVDIKGSIAKIN